MGRGAAAAWGGGGWPGSARWRGFATGLCESGLGVGAGRLGAGGKVGYEGDGPLCGGGTSKLPPPPPPPRSASKSPRLKAPPSSPPGGPGVGVIPFLRQRSISTAFHLAYFSLVCTWGGGG